MSELLELIGPVVVTGTDDFVVRSQVSFFGIGAEIVANIFEPPSEGIIKAQSVTKLSCGQLH